MKHVVAYFKVLSRILPGVIKESCAKCQDNWSSVTFLNQRLFEYEVC